MAIVGGFFTASSFSMSLMFCSWNMSLVRIPFCSRLKMSKFTFWVAGHIMYKRDVCRRSTYMVVNMWWLCWMVPAWAIWLLSRNLSTHILDAHLFFWLPSFLRPGQCLTLAALSLAKSLVDVRQCDPRGGSAWKTGGGGAIAGREGRRSENTPQPTPVYHHHSPTSSSISSNSVSVATRTTQKLQVLALALPAHLIDVAQVVGHKFALCGLGLLFYSC